MHVFYRRIGILMKKCLIDMFGDTESVPVAMKNGQNVAILYKKSEHVFFIASMISRESRNVHNLAAKED